MIGRGRLVVIYGYVWLPALMEPSEPVRRVIVSLAG